VTTSFPTTERGPPAAVQVQVGHFERWTPERIRQQNIVWDALEGVGRRVAWVDVSADGILTACTEHGEIEIDDVPLFLRAVMQARAAA